LRLEFRDSKPKADRLKPVLPIHALQFGIVREQAHAQAHGFGCGGRIAQRTIGSKK
jgi:hypothetical protein